MIPRLRQYTVRTKYNARTSWRKRQDPSLWPYLNRPDESWLWKQPVHICNCVHCSITERRRA